MQKQFGWMFSVRLLVIQHIQTIKPECLQCNKVYCNISITFHVKQTCSELVQGRLINGFGWMVLTEIGKCFRTAMHKGGSAMAGSYEAHRILSILAVTITQSHTILWVFFVWSLN